MSAKWTYMAGTEGTGAYVVVGKTDCGVVGFRDLGDVCRVRVEPIDGAETIIAATLTYDEGWKQPSGGQKRFSKVVKTTELLIALADAKAAIGFGTMRSVQNPTGNARAAKLVATA